jgi:hypothetical protein
MKRIAFTLFLALTLKALALAPPLLAAESYPLLDFKHRSQFSVSSGYLAFKGYGDAGEPWRGIDLAAAYTYSLHPSLAIYTIYGHGFPFESVDGHENQLRLAANLKAFPGAESPASVWRVDLGAGLMWRGDATVKDWTGLEAHLALSAKLNEGLSAFAAFYHGFATQPESQPDIDFLRAGLAVRLGR